MRRLKLCLVAAVACALPSSIVLAGPLDERDPPTPTTAPTTPTTIAAEVTVPGSTVPGTPGTVVASIPCDWFRVDASQEYADQLNGVLEVIEIIIEMIGGEFVIYYTYYSEDGTLHRYNDDNGEYEYQVIADCTNATDPAGWSTGDTDWWTDTPPDPGILLPGLRRRVTEPVQPPAADISPVEGIVNLGMWLAVDPQEEVSVTAYLGPTVWATTTASMTATTYEFHGGTEVTTVTCDGSGTPIPESALDSIEQGPCGHTVTEPVDGGSIVVTATWTVSWELSDGRTGTYAPLELVEVVPYDVVEIQTVGRGN